MLKNYFKTAWRTLWRNKVFSVIKILGLSIGLTVCMLIFLYTKDEISFDKFHENKTRPLSHYAFGRIDRWARLASLAPAVANWVGRAPGLSGAIKAALHVAPERRLPQFARAFTRRRRPAVEANSGGREVFLWADTFNNYFHPGVLQAAYKVLIANGFRVTVTSRHMCCGRPLYDFGMLDVAKEYLRTVLDALEPRLAAGVPIVVLEPSCASVFRASCTRPM